MQLHELSELSAPARIEAMELLWQAMSEDVQHSAHLIPSWHQQVLERRLQAMQSGDENTTPWEMAKNRLRDLTQVTR